MATPDNLERIGNGNPDGCIVRGQHRLVISGAGAARSLQADESGALVLLDKADGMTITLPTPAEGMQFEFFSTVSVAGGTIKIVTNNPATQFLIGEILAYTTATASPGGFAANGTTIVSVAIQTGGTFGGLIGTRLLFTALGTTQWAVNGQTVGSGTLVSPFATT
jgi:hypothetical protein